MNRIKNYNKLNVQLNYITDDEIIKLIGEQKKLDLVQIQLLK
jgi:hypothetical protein